MIKKKVARLATLISFYKNYFFQTNFNNTIAPEGIISASRIGIKISSKKSGYIPSILATVNRSNIEKLEIRTVNKTFIQFSFARVNKNITTDASTKSITTNNRSSLTLHSSIKKMKIARMIIVTINQNIQLFNQDLNFSMISRLKNKKSLLKSW